MQAAALPVHDRAPAPRRRILLVEDSERLAALIRDYLSRNGLELLVEGDGANAVRRFMADQPDLVILDVMLPNKDGYQICRELRAMSDVPILVYTARREDIDHVVGLELGADDYVIKPLEPRVLLARIEALLRRAGAALQAKGDSTLAIGPITVNRPARLVHYRGKAVDFTSADFDMFWQLFSRHGETVTRDQLQRVLLNTPYDGVGRAIDSRVYRLRKKLEEAGAPPDLIVSIRSSGYLLALDA